VPPSSGPRTQYDNMNVNCLEVFEIYVRFEALVAVMMKRTLFWDVMPLITIEVTDVSEGHALQSRCYSRGVDDLFSLPLRNEFNFLDTATRPAISSTQNYLRSMRKVKRPEH
jgi:hypothetical protein